MPCHSSLPAAPPSARALPPAVAAGLPSACASSCFGGGVFFVGLRLAPHRLLHCVFSPVGQRVPEAPAWPRSLVGPACGGSHRGITSGAWDARSGPVCPSWAAPWRADSGGHGWAGGGTVGTWGYACCLLLVSVCVVSPGPRVWAGFWCVCVVRPWALTAHRGAVSFCLACVPRF